MGSHACAVFFCWWLLPKMSRSFQGGDPRILVCGICICTPRRSQAVSCGWTHTHTRDRATQEDLQTLLCLTGLYKIMLKRGCHLESESGSALELGGGQSSSRIQSPPIYYDDISRRPEEAAAGVDQRYSWLAWIFLEEFPKSADFIELPEGSARFIFITLLHSVSMENSWVCYFYRHPIRIRRVSVYSISKVKRGEGTLSNKVH